MTNTVTEQWDISSTVGSSTSTSVADPGTVSDSSQQGPLALADGDLESVMLAPKCWQY
jgi:hypothetical protein